MASSNHLATSTPLEDSPKEGAPAGQGFKGHKALDKKGDARTGLTDGERHSGGQPASSRSKRLRDRSCTERGR
jgi:hypothetical protein